MSELPERMTERLADLLREAELGEERLQALENEAIVVRQTLLRIGGAVQVLRELMAEDSAVDVAVPSGGAGR